MNRDAAAGNLRARRCNCTANSRQNFARMPTLIETCEAENTDGEDAETSGRSVTVCCLSQSVISFILFLLCRPHYPEGSDRGELK